MKFTKNSDEFKFFGEYYEVVKTYYEMSNDEWDKAIDAVNNLCERWKNNPKVYRLAVKLGMAFLRFADEEQNEYIHESKIDIKERRKPSRQ